MTNTATPTTTCNCGCAQATRGAAAITEAIRAQKAFIPFVTCGDPDLPTTKAIVRALAEEGASVIELGVPFSDPTAEGVVIQDANLRALSGGVDTDKIFAMVEELRKGEGDCAPVEVPLLFMTYGNVVFHYGIERFVARCVEVGIDGLILPDVPVEEKEEFAQRCREGGLAMVSLIAPTSEERISMIAREAEGFIYLVSSLGVTGVRSAITTDLDSIIAKIREASTVPVAIGFGISTPEQAASMAAKSDGAIVGSAIVKIIAEHGTQAAGPVRAYARSIIDAIRA